jgi:hypothetical protein
LNISANTKPGFENILEDKSGGQLVRLLKKPELKISCYCPFIKETPNFPYFCRWILSSRFHVGDGLKLRDPEDTSLKEYLSIDTTFDPLLVRHFL